MCTLGPLTPDPHAPTHFLNPNNPSIHPARPHFHTNTPCPPPTPPHPPIPRRMSWTAGCCTVGAACCPWPTLERTQTARRWVAAAPLTPPQRRRRRPPRHLRPGASSGSTEWAGAGWRRCPAGSERAAAASQVCQQALAPPPLTPQFFVLYKSAHHLDYKHTVFGRVVGGEGGGQSAGPGRAQQVLRCAAGPGTLRDKQVGPGQHCLRRQLLPPWSCACGTAVTQQYRLALSRWYCRL
jgi:hypothetical protein